MSFGPWEDRAEVSRRTAWVALGVIVALGMALRVIGLTGESAWWDEYTSLMHLDEPGLFSFLSANRMYDPATLPLYYAVEYLWASVAGTATAVVRVPSLVFGGLLIVAAYALGRTLASRRAGLLVAACVAFSPIHLFHAQGIRMYVLFTLLAVLSLHTYARWRQQPEGRRLWAHGLVQFLLSWTHPFAVLIPAVEGMAWLCEGRAHYRGMVRWGVVSALAWVPALLHIATLRYYSKEFTNWIVIPDLQGLFHDLFQDDVVRSGYQVHFSERAWQWLPWGLEGAVLRAGTLWDYSLTGLVILGFVWMLWVALRSYRGAAVERRGVALALVFWAVVPVVILLLASYVSRPMIAPRYTVYCSIGFYVMIALMLLRRRGAVRLLLEAAVCGLFLMQAGLMYPGPQRTDYLGAGNYIKQQADAAADVLIVTTSFELPIVKYNVDFGALHVVSREKALQSVVIADALLDAGVPTVWVLHVIPYWNYEEPPEHWGRELGLACETRSFPGMQGILVTRLSKGAGVHDAAKRAAVMQAFAAGLAEKGEQSWFTELLREAAKKEAPWNLAEFRVACALCKEINPALGSLYCGADAAALPAVRVEAMAALSRAGEFSDVWGGSESLEKIAVIDPSFGFPHLLLGFVYAMEGKVERVLPALEEAARRDAVLAPMLGDYVAALKAGNLEGAVQGADKLLPALEPDSVNAVKGISYLVLGVPLPEDAQ